jgi:carotenoid 1,2-hydratase
MTERGRRSVERSAPLFRIGPSCISWQGRTLTVDIDEIGAPLPQRVRGRVVLNTAGLCSFNTALDAAGRHRWGPIAPCARIDVDLQQPSMRWSGNAYMDSNEGSEPIDRAFREWDWSRAQLADGSTAVIYDVRPKSGADRIIAQRFALDGSHRAFQAPGRQALPRSAWGISRTSRSDAGVPPRQTQSLEDTPFYARAVLEVGLLGERVTAVHETLNVPRLRSLPVRLMLPWRMPRRA